jgi:hypothetical protein
VNIGNNLIKYAISIKLKELGYIPYIIGTHYKYKNIDFINKTTNLVVIHKNFSEIKQNDYNILMVNSDQTWRKFDEHFYDYGFLKFAENWKIKKFVYGASIGYDYWRLSKQDDDIAKKLLKNFSGISTREKGSIQLIKKHLDINVSFVLDPTLLIDKHYYLDIIRNYHGKVIMKKQFIFIYTIFSSKHIINTSKMASSKLNYETYFLPFSKNILIEDFIYYLIKSDAVITDSYHGTIFSIIFNLIFEYFLKNINSSTSKNKSHSYFLLYLL